jgi:hypothetical protein
MNNKKYLLSTAIFPPIAWIAILVQFPKAHIDIFETFPKQTYRNRYSILSPNGILDLSIPIKKPFGNNSKTFEIITNNNNWKQQHIESIKTAYSKSPYFEYFFDEVLKFYNYESIFLHKINIKSLECISNILKYKMEYEFTKDFIHPDNTTNNNYIDTRYIINHKNKKCLDFKSQEYYQIFYPKFNFTPNLSILDLIFNTGLESIQYLKNFPLEKYIKYINY